MINHTISDETLSCITYTKEDTSMTFYFWTNKYINRNERAEQWKNTRESWNTMNRPGKHPLKGRNQFSCLISSVVCTFL